jgi:hypothetical protein
MKSIDPQIMQQVLGGTKSQLDIISKNYSIVANNLEEMRGNQNQQMLALASVYAAIEAIAEKIEVELPKPLIDMKIEESDKE